MDGYRSPSSSPPRIRSNSPVANPNSAWQRGVESAIGKLPHVVVRKMGFTQGPKRTQNPFSEEGGHDQPFSGIDEYSFTGKIPESPSEIEIDTGPPGESGFLQGFDGLGEINMSPSPSRGFSSPSRGPSSPSRGPSSPSRDPSSPSRGPSSPSRGFSSPSRGRPSSPPPNYDDFRKGIRS